MSTIQIPPGMLGGNDDRPDRGNRIFNRVLNLALVAALVFGVVVFYQDWRQNQQLAAHPAETTPAGYEYPGDTATAANIGAWGTCDTPQTLNVEMNRMPRASTVNLTVTTAGRQPETVPVPTDTDGHGVWAVEWPADKHPVVVVTAHDTKGRTSTQMRVNFGDCSKTAY